MRKSLSFGAPTGRAASTIRLPVVLWANIAFPPLLRLQGIALEAFYSPPGRFAATLLWRGGTPGHGRATGHPSPPGEGPREARGWGELSLTRAALMTSRTPSISRSISPFE